MGPYIFVQMFHIRFIKFFCILIFYLLYIWENQIIIIYIIIKHRLIDFVQSYTIMEWLLGVTNVGLYALYNLLQYYFKRYNESLWYSITTTEHLAMNHPESNNIYDYENSPITLDGTIHRHY